MESDIQRNIMSYLATRGIVAWRIVWICDNATEVALVHEIYHSTSWVLEHFGVKDEETGAYIIAYLYRKSIERFRKWQKEHLQKK